MEEQDDRQYKVVVNHEEQYSIWFADRQAPAGWREVGFRGSKPDCLSHINEVWTDMRPLSLRKKMEELASQPPLPEPPPPAPEPSLVDRLSQGEHPVVIVLRGDESVSELARRIEDGYVHVKFTSTRGGTELGVRLEKERCRYEKEQLATGRGQITLVGRLKLDYVPVECTAVIDLATFAGSGSLRATSGDA